MLFADRSRSALLRWTRGLCFALACGCTAGDLRAAEPTTYTTRENVVFAETDGIGLLADVFTPTAQPNGLAIVDVASGAWHSDRGKIRDHARARMFDTFCGRGYVVYAVRPGSITKFSAPEMVDHLHQALRWVRGRAMEDGVDAERLGLTGASAGGHLASLAALTAPAELRVRGVAVFFPPTDFLNYGGRRIDPGESEGMGRIVSRLLGQSPLSEDAAEIDRLLEAISPARRVQAGAPPFLLVHGDADPVVPLQQSELLVERLKSANVPVELIVKAGGAHPWPTIHEEVALMADWFDRTLATPVEPAADAAGQ